MQAKILICIAISLTQVQSNPLASCPASPPPVHTRQACWSWVLDDNENGCLARGCCWDPKLIVSNSSAAGHPVLPMCYMPPLSGSDGGFRPISKLHVIEGCHFDAGFADTIQNIVGGRWFQQFFPRAASVGRDLEGWTNTTARLRFTAQSWVVWLFLNCPENSGLDCPSLDYIRQFNASVGAGYITWHALPMNFEPELMTAGMIEAAIQLTHRLDDDFSQPRKTVMSQRDVPFMSRAAIPALVRNGVDIVSVGVNGGSTPPNLPPVFLWRDPPSGAQVLVLLLQGGYGGLHVIKQAPFTPMLVPGLDEAAVVDWRGDNAGPPPSAADLAEDFTTLKGQFNGSLVAPSSFEEFGAAIRASMGVLHGAEGSNGLSGFVPGTLAGSSAEPPVPVITSEVGDTWIYGVPSDPVKVARMRAAHRARAYCLGPGGSCSSSDPRVFNATAFLLKNSEHTWGLDHKTVLSPIDQVLHRNWSNSEFHAIARGLEPSRDPLDLTDKYRQLASSWTTQRRFGLDYVLQALGDKHPLAEAIRSAWADQEPAVPRHSSNDCCPPAANYIVSDTPYLAHGSATAPIRTFELGSRWRVGVNGSTGAICSLLDVVSGTDYAGAGGCSASVNGTGVGGRSLFAAQYMTLDAVDYDLYELLYNYLWVVDFIVGDDFDDQSKQGIGDYNASSQLLETMLVGAWVSNSTSSLNHSTASFRLDLEMRLPDHAVQLAGGFYSLWLSLEVQETRGSSVPVERRSTEVYGNSASALPPNISVTFQGFNKTATRMPEALFLRVNPRRRSTGSNAESKGKSAATERLEGSRNGVPTWLHGDGWCMQKLDSWMQAWPIPWGGSTRMHGVSDGGIAFLPGPVASSRHPNWRDRNDTSSDFEPQLKEFFKQAAKGAAFSEVGSRADSGGSSAGMLGSVLDRLQRYAPADGALWLNGSLVAAQIQGAASQADDCSTFMQGLERDRAGAYGTRSVASVPVGAFSIESPDAAVVAFGSPTTFAVPTNLPPDFEGGGASFVLHSNAWGTNYLSVSLGSPMPDGGPQETDVKWRFNFVPLS